MARRRIFWERYVSSVEQQLDAPDDENGAKVTPVTFSPHGLIPITSPMLYTKHLDMWTGHTNFDITEDIIFGLNEIPGVEVLMPITRYSFRVGFKTKARLFNLDDIKTDIEILCKTKDDVMSGFTPKQRELIREEKKIVESSPYWLIFIFPNGHIYSVASEIYSKEYVKKQKVLKDAQEKIGGTLLESSHLDVRRVQNGKA